MVDGKMVEEFGFRVFAYTETVLLIFACILWLVDKMERLDGVVMEVLVDRGLAFGH
jgi:hypothetical protein